MLSFTFVRVCLCLFIFLWSRPKTARKQENKSHSFSWYVSINVFFSLCALSSDVMLSSKWTVYKVVLITPTFGQIKFVHLFSLSLPEKSWLKSCVNNSFFALVIYFLIYLRNSYMYMYIATNNRENYSKTSLNRTWIIRKS